jgi:mono/diheme cytochrome c family protein
LGDPFTVESLSERGVLGTARFARLSPGPALGSAELAALEPADRASREAEAGREVFRLECSVCHTEEGHLGIRRLVRGRSVAALETVLQTLAEPVTAAGDPISWRSPHLRLATRLGRRMPPFVGSAQERRALAIHLARVGGDPEAGLSEVSSGEAGADVFETYCAACHGLDSPWPMALRLRGRTYEELYDLIGRLDEVREEMPAFAGSDDERIALAEYLAGLSTGTKEEMVP